MRLILKLLAAQWRGHWLRTLIVAAALTTSVAMVVSVVGGQQVLMSRFRAAAGRPANPLGRFELLVQSGSPRDVEADRRRMGPLPPAPALGEGLLRWLRSSQDVRELVESCRLTGESVPTGPMYSGPMYRPGDTLSCPVMGTGSPKPPRAMVEGEWVSDRSDAVVVDASIAQRLGGTVGGSFQLATITGRHEVRIAGILEDPELGGRGMMGGMSGIHVSPAFFERLAGGPAGVNHVLVDLKDGVSEETFGGALEQAARDSHQAVTVQTAADFQNDAARMAMMFGGGGGGFFPLLNNAGMNLAVLAALFIVFNAFSMGVGERSRQLAMLRAVGMTRGGVVTMIAVEGVLLAALGWLCGVGAGCWLLQRSLSQGSGMMGMGRMGPGAMSSAMSAEAPLDMGFLLGVGAITSFGAVLLAAALPAFLAARKRPGEGMTLPVALEHPSLAKWLAAAGLALIAACPAIAFTRLFPDALTARVLMPASILAALIGFVLLLPLAIRVCGGAFGRVAGLLLGLNHRLLSGTLRANLWRTVGCAAALMVGLGVFIVVQIWGRSMLTPFLVAPRSPDAVAVVFPDGVPADRAPAVAALAGVTKAFPMVLQHPELAYLPADVPVAGIFSRDVVYLGCDVEGLVGEPDGMIEAPFVRGEPAQAYALVKSGGHCLITDSLYLRSPGHYDVGRPLVLQTVEQPRRQMTYTIAGVVQMSGWHLLTKSARMRRGLGRVGGIVVVSEADARAAYPGSNYGAFWFRMAEGADPASLEAPIIRIVDPNARPMRPASRSASRPASGPASGLAGAGGLRGGRGGGPTGMGRGAGSRTGRGGGPPGGRFGDPNAIVMMDSPVYCRLTNTRAMTDAIRRRADGIIEAMTIYPLLTLGLASLAVAYTVMASVRSRSWEIGILRSVGLTRGQLLRQVLAEGLLIGLLACVASLAFGLLASVAGIAVTSRTWAVRAPFVIPWGRLGLGIGAAVLACVLASLWPAIFAAGRQPIRLLQDGRAMD